MLYAKRCETSIVIANDVPKYQLKTGAGICFRVQNRWQCFHIDVTLLQLLIVCQPSKVVHFTRFMCNRAVVSLTGSCIALSALLAGRQIYLSSLIVNKNPSTLLSVRGTGDVLRSHILMLSPSFLLQMKSRVMIRLFTVDDPPSSPRHLCRLSPCLFVLFFSLHLLILRES